MKSKMNALLILQKSYDVQIAAIFDLYVACVYWLPKLLEIL